MNIKKLSDHELHTHTLDLVKEERRLTTEVLAHLREISDRRLYASRGFSSLWEYCVKGLGYTEAAAQRRVATMRLISDIPAVEEKIKNGSLSLTVASQIQSTVRSMKCTEEKPIQRKMELVEALEGKSTREAEKILATLLPERQPTKERLRVISQTQTEVRYILDRELETKLKKVKALLSHKKFNPTHTELIHMMADLVLEKMDPLRKPKKTKVTATEKQTPRPPAPEVTSRYIPVALKTTLYERSGARCEFTDPVSKRRCEETQFLQVEHVLPVALGGATELSNCELLCRTHNLLRGVRIFGEPKRKPGEKFYFSSSDRAQSN